MDRKCGRRRSKGRPSRSKKRMTCGYHYSAIEPEMNFASTSAEKLLNSTDREITVNQMHGYRFVQFFAVFSALSELVVCKICHKGVQFSEASARGLGFKIAVTCECGTTYINSCPLIQHGFEINRRIVCVMRLLGIGNSGLNLFCGLMDLAKEFYSNTYYAALGHLYTASKAVYELCASSAIQEEREKTLEKENSNKNLTVAGDGTWRKRGISSLFGVVRLIGKHSCKVIDLITKSSSCKMCETWEAQIDDEAEYEEWNQVGSSRKMEEDAIKEMFGRSVQNHKVKYTRYVGDGDGKTCKRIVDLNPYEGETQNENEGFNGLLWHFTPKHTYFGGKTVEMAAYLATGIYNEGYHSILKTFETMGIVIGPEAKSFADTRNAQRMPVADKRHCNAMKEARTARRKAQSALQEFYEEEEGVLYGPGIAD